MSKSLPRASSDFEEMIYANILDMNPEGHEVAGFVNLNSKKATSLTFSIQISNCSLNRVKIAPNNA